MEAPTSSETERLRQSEERFRLVVEAAPSGMIMVDEHGAIILLNSQAERLFGFARTELIGKGIEVLVPERFRGSHPGFRGGFHASPQTRAMGAGRDLFGLRKDGTEVPIEIGLNPIRSGEGIFVLASIIDITERKRAELAVRTSLVEKETLLKEIHHRVKNNLQVISSILSLQTGALHDPRDRAMFDECQQRVRGMAMIHERLYRSQSLATLDFGDHMRDLVQMLVRSYGPRGVRLVMEIEPVALDLDTAIPLGLIVNELVSNALKHAFVPAGSGTLKVRLSALPGGLKLVVSDDGRGLPGDFDISRARTLGMKMIQTLSHQIRARLEIANHQGAMISLTLPGAEQL